MFDKFNACVAVTHHEYSKAYRCQDLQDRRRYCVGLSEEEVLRHFELWYGANAWLKDDYEACQREKGPEALRYLFGLEGCDGD